MKSIAELRKEKQLLISYTHRCNHYISLVNEKLTELGNKYRDGEIDREEYHNKLNYGLGGKSFRHYIELYNAHILRYERRLVDIDNEIKRRGRNKSVLISFFILTIIFSSLFLINNGGITGKVTFSMVESNGDNINQEFNQSESFVWKPTHDGRLNTVSLTGKYDGEGSLRIYLDLKGGSKLIYATESSAIFESECGNACYLYETSQDEYNIRVEMPPGNKLMIDKVDYLVSELEEFKISPSNVTINLTDNRFIKNKFGIYNSRNKNFSVAIYAEGELTEYTTLYTSYERFGDNDTVKYVSYDIDMPLKIEPGVYREKIIVRYLPAGEFKGEAPSEEHEVLVRVGESENEVLAPKNIDYIYILVILLGLIFLFNIIFFIMKKK